ncbi:MAG: hypothetical protein IKK08_08005 [Clostridia bacterium]|nr:hypothetical protein [Clostridia bacterium]
MKRQAPDRTAYQPKPVEQVEVNEGKVKARIILLILAVVIAIVAFGWVIFSRTHVNTGWREIEVASDGTMNCSQDFQFNYYLGGSGMSAAAELKAITLLYTEATEKAYNIFNAHELSPELNNLFQLNLNPNKPIKVDPALYAALETVDRLDSRYLFLAPMYSEYHSLFFCNDDWETAGYDPVQNPDIREYAAQVAAFAADPGQINIQLMGDDTVQLTVSESYTAFAKENGIDCYADFYWMKNAFIIDYLANTMEDAGYNRGVISSYDGFSRCLGEEKLAYSHQLFDLQDGKAYRAATMDYSGGTNLVCLRSFPLNRQKELYYYRFKDGSFRTAHVDIADGISKTALPTLAATSGTKSCAEILLRLLPFYATETWTGEVHKTLPAEGIYPVSITDRVVCQSGTQVSLSDLYEGYRIQSAE